MKQYNLRIPTTITLACFLMASTLLTLSCRKEKAPEPSNLDKNYFVISDNPNDPIDHAVYEFYKNTNIAIFYSDSIYKKRISRDNETPARYAYIKLSLNYSLLGENSSVYSEPLSSRNKIPALLNLLLQEMAPKLPLGQLIPSILLIDSFSIPYPIMSNVQISHGWTALQGFNTIGIKVKDVEAMNSGERKIYAASILAGIAVNRINDLYASQLQKDFFSISREVTKNLLPIDIYYGFPYLYLLPPGMVPPPQDFGLLFHPTFVADAIPQISTPRESDDIRAFLTSVFCYTDQEFADLHPNETLVLKKFSILRNIVKEAGFKFPD